jgi:peroxiredoxin
LIARARGWIVAAAGLGALLAAAGCASTGPGAGESVLDMTWGWGWDRTAAGGPYADRTPVEREALLDYYRAHVRMTDGSGKALQPVDQVAFLPAPEPNAPTGDAVQPVEFVDTAGKPVRLQDYRGKRSLVLAFTRGFPGYICPLCTSYTAQLAHRYQEITAAGAEVLVVFPGAPDKVKEFVRAAREIVEQEGAGALPFPVLLDVGLKNVAVFGIQGDLARPSTYVIGRDGVVRYAFVGNQPHERPDVDTILAELKRAK